MASSSFWEFMKELGIAFGADIAYEKIRKRAGEKTGDVIADVVFVDKRGELLKNIAALDPASVNNIIRRHKVAIDNLTENRFAKLLCKIPENGRSEVLKWLNNVDDAEFWQMLELLENDAIAQYLNRFVRHCKNTLGEDASSTKTKLVNVAGMFDAFAATHVAPVLGSLNEILEARHADRRRRRGL